MELYGKISKSIPQKIIIITLELVLLLLSYLILFRGAGDTLFNLAGIPLSGGNMESRIITFVFSIIVFARLTFMMLYLLKRKIPWEETFSVPMAFALYFIGYSLLVYNRHMPTDWIDVAGVLIFIAGSLLNTVAELQRHFWKQHPENKGRLYTKGLFKYSMHINYFGDILWVTGYAVITRNWYSIAIPLFLACFFIFYNIPKLDAYLASKYGEAFAAYSSKTKRLIPFIY